MKMLCAALSNQGNESSGEGKLEKIFEQHDGCLQAGVGVGRRSSGWRGGDFLLDKP